VAGTDATAAFYNLHRQEVLQKYADLCIGTLENETPEVINMQPGDLSKVPYGEPLWLTTPYKNPYYTESHRKLQKLVRTFVDTHVYPEAQAKEEDGTYISQELVDKMAASRERSLTTSTTLSLPRSFPEPTPEASRTATWPA
jgi:hypothetical protein